MHRFPPEARFRDGSPKDKQLLSSMGQRFGCHRRIEAALLLYKVPQSDSFENGFHFRHRCCATFRVEVEFEGAWEEEWILWETEQSVSDGVSGDVADVDPIDTDCASGGI
jgi:hypothetical protein